MQTQEIRRLRKKAQMGNIYNGDTSSNYYHLADVKNRPDYESPTIEPIKNGVMVAGTIGGVGYGTKAFIDAANKQNENNIRKLKLARAIQKKRQ